jgi:hypothetical protein
MPTGSAEASRRVQRSPTRSIGASFDDLSRHRGRAEKTPPLTADPCARRLRMEREAFLYAFAFHHLEEGKVAVRLGFEAETPACFEQLTQVGILLPIPEKVRVPLEQAASGKAGFLMADRNRVGSPRFSRRCT